MSYNPLGNVCVERGDWWYVRRGYWESKLVPNGIYKPNFVNKERFYEFKSGMLIQPDGTPDTRRREIILLERRTEKDLTEAQAVEYVAGLELSQIKGLVRNKYLRRFALEHCRKEFVPAFLNHEDLAEVIERRMRE
jgi:hypothetical protein